MARYVSLLLVLFLATAAHARAEPPVAKVVVQESGSILLDGRPSSLEALRARFAELAAAGGEVWYFRANPTGEPPASAIRVIQLIVEARLPVRLAMDAEFTRFMSPG